MIIKEVTQRENAKLGNKQINIWDIWRTENRPLWCLFEEWIIWGSHGVGRKVRMLLQFPSQKGMVAGKDGGWINCGL